MKTAKILVKGNIQKVGFRAKIIEIADNLNIKGEVENLKDSNVEIIAQGENEEQLKKFAEKINIKNTLINVSDVSFEYIETDKIYFDFKKIVKAKETDERLDSAVVELKKLIVVTEKGNDKLSGKLDNIHRDLNKGNENLSSKMDIIHTDLSVNLKAFHHDTIQRFDIVDAKYGKISQNMEKAISSINKVSVNMEKLFEKSERDREDYKKSMKDLVGAILTLAEKK